MVWSDAPFFQYHNTKLRKGKKKFSENYELGQQERIRINPSSQTR
jgi:hypothetical protein